MAPNSNMLACALPTALHDAVMTVCNLVQRAGGRAWMVGGAVRDMFLNTPVKDVDLEVFGIEPAALKTLLASSFRLDLVGESFGILKLHGVDIDISIPRRESKHGAGHKGFDVLSDPFLSVAEAASRRDFTMNAMYLDPLNGTVCDPWHGRADLEARILRHVSPKFVEDPLRVLRGMQFAARFEAVAAPETIALCRSMTLEGLAPERIFDEWCKFICKGVKPSMGLAFLRATEWVQFFPELAALIQCPQEPEWHPEGDVWNHTCACMDAFARARVGDRQEDLVVGFAVLCHDFGKPATTAFLRGRIRSIAHEEGGVQPTHAFLSRMTNQADFIQAVSVLVAHHLKPFELFRAQAGDAAVRRLAVKTRRIDRLCRVACVDQRGRPPFPVDDSATDWLLARAAALAVQDGAPKPLVLGRDLIAKGFTPSPRFSVWLTRCYEAQLDGTFTTHADGLAFLDTVLQEEHEN